MDHLWKCLSFLTHSSPMHPFSSPWKHRKTWRFSAFRGYRKGALGTNGLKRSNKMWTPSGAKMVKKNILTMKIITFHSIIAEKQNFWKKKKKVSSSAKLSRVMQKMLKTYLVLHAVRHCHQQWGHSCDGMIT